MKKSIFIAVFFLFFVSILPVSVSAGNYMNFYSSAVVQPGQNISLTGSVHNASNTSQLIPNINITAAISSSLSSIAANGSSASFNVSAPNAVGEYSLLIYSNDSSIMNKTFTVYVSNVTSGSITFTGKYPPFSAGATFTINVTLKNATSGSAIANYIPNVSIFSTNGAQVSWNIANLSVKSDANGVMIYNITIPSGVDGQYVIVVEHGAIYKIFEISSGYVIAAGTEDTSGAVSSNFAQGSTINIVAKIRDSSGNPITSVSNITAYITLPNSTVINKTLSAYPGSGYDGYYNKTFDIGTAAGDIGQENIKIVAGIEGKLVDSSTLFSVKTFTVKLEMQKEFFEDWGGQAAFKANENASLNIIPINLTDNSIISPGGSGAPLPACNSTYLQLVDVFYANGTSINNTNNIKMSRFNTGRYLANEVCKITFNAPPETGIYGMRVNVTISNITVVGESYFSSQKVMMKASPVSSLGGSDDFMTMVSPGENITIELTSYNLSSKVSLNGLNITGISVTRMLPLEFKSGSSEVTNLTEGNNYTVAAGTSSSNPTVTVAIPTSIMGPTLVEIRANVSGEIVTGSAFFVSNYLNGFISPQTSGGGEGDMGKSDPFSSCSGTVTFSGRVNEVKSSSAAQGATVLSILQARDELTGKDISPYLTISGSTTSNSQGQITVNVSFNPGYAFSGSYFMALNTSYQGKSAGLPAGFMCKRLNYWPQIMSAGGNQQSWRIAPSGGVNITISDVTRLNDSKKISNRSYVQLPRIMNFNPTKGGMSLLVPVNSSLLNYSFVSTDAAGDYSNITANAVSFLIYPQNFTSAGQTLARWPNGFIDLQPVVTSVDIDRASDTGMGGFEVVPFDAYSNFDWSNNQISAGDTKSYNIYARTNVSPVQGFSVSIGRPWEGDLVNATNLQYNNTQNMSDTQVWNVTFTIPAVVKKGEAQLAIEVNNSNGDKSTVYLWTNIVKYSVNTPSEEGLNFDYYMVPVQDAGMNSPQQGGNTSVLGWNMTYINLTYKTWSHADPWGVEGKWNGSVMVKNKFNGTRYGQTSQPVTYNASTKVLLLDNATPGVYDTLILNNSNGNLWNITIVNLNRRNFSVPNGNGGLYLWNIEGTYVKLINSTITGSWGGSNQKNTTFKIPYVVKLSNAAQSGVTMSVNAIGNQQDGGGGKGGFGFSSKLAEGLNYTSSSANTDANGVAFVDVNISNSGKFVVFWKVNTSSDSDTASMSSGTQVEAKSFQTDGGLAYNLPANSVIMEKNITYANIPNAWKNFLYIYNGTIQEVGGNDFIMDSNPQKWYIFYNSFTNQTIINNESNAGGDNAVFLNETTMISEILPGGGSIGVNKILKNSSENGTMTMQFYQSEPGISGSKMVMSATENVTVKACANSFDRPNSKPREGASFYLYVTDWSSMGPPQQKNLTMFDLNGTQYSASSLPVLGPKGCFVLNATATASPLTAWPRFAQIQGAITYGSDIESVWAGEVFYNQGI